MGVKKNIILIAAAGVLLITALFTYKERDLFSKQPMVAFSKIVNQGNLDTLTLTIYYVRPYTLTPIAWNVSDLISMYDEKIIIDGSDLVEHIDLFIQMSNVTPTPVADETQMNARVYYVFKTSLGRKILEVSMWGGRPNRTIFVNGVEVEENDIYYEILVPFLSEKALQGLGFR